MTSTPRDASSLILVRDTEQALLIRRHEKLAFAGGSWVFPGGKSEPSDASRQTLDKLGLLDGVAEGTPDAAAMLRTRALMVTACRETFEEIGVVVAYRRSGEICDAPLADALQSSRSDITRDASLFAGLLADHGLIIDPRQLISWSHWITPSLAPRRYDTRFFLTPMPPGQTVRCDSAEATEHLWMDLAGLPDESLVQAPPTRFSLGDLSLSLRDHGGLARLLRSEAARVITPMMPKMARIDGRLMVLMPWDPDYATAPGEGTPLDLPIPAMYRRFPSRLAPPPFSGMPAG
ncbi:MAG TPA: hypothetical protein VK437_03810 [Steroidobacteraceae bacterium]|nr:hypothetical protein [Steroidobacteraceae bacterium]